MLEAVFKGHLAFIVIAITISIVFGLAVYFASKEKTDRPLHLALWCASIVSVLCLTLWSTGGTQGSGTCVINLNVFEPFGTEQGILNCLMFVPVGFLGVLAARRILPGAASGVIASAVIETTQGAIPAIGRACDTSDFVSNSTGSILGALVAFILVRTAHGRLDPWRPKAWRMAITYVSFAVLVGVVWATSIQPRTVAATESIASADSEQRKAITEVVHQAFGDHYAIGDVKFAPSDGSASGTIMAILPVGYVQVNWPGQDEITASLDMSANGKPSGFPVPGAPSEITSSAQAKDIAIAYAEHHFPWGIPKSDVKVSAVGENAALGWMVSWRRYRNDVLMPMRLDVQIDRTGRVSQLSTRKVPDVLVPAVRIDKQRATQLALKAVPGCGKAEVGELLAVRKGTSWHAVWRILITCEHSSTLTHVNARSGVVEMKEEHPNVAS
ncbi:VanZ family protein [Streptomyces sp. RS10V-4]|uniref:VanZ family protein n=1 Tax=Streptomyces rhizoryzae TaxID=2932493 RepID=UPI0020037C68|nr:VanZ family protein [Streptomyces rhizoryzae]MCK7623329.1 VanZ family protein [Streptomyces rhizoryzae]